MAKLNPIDSDKAHHKAPTNGYIPHVDVIPMFSSRLKSPVAAGLFFMLAKHGNTICKHLACVNKTM
jgi:hypothetical protein